jgi:hypothetical protein
LPDQLQPVFHRRRSMAGGFILFWNAILEGAR